MTDNETTPEYRAWREAQRAAVEAQRADLEAAIRRLEQSGGWSNPEVGAIRRLEQSLAEARQDLVDLDESPAPYNWQWRDLGTFRDIPPPVQLVDFDGENYL